METRVTENLFDTARWLVGAVARGLLGRDHGVLDRLSGQALDAAHFRVPQPARLPVLRHLAECTAEAMLLDADLAAAIAAIEEHLHWRQSSSYSDQVLGEGFSANYGWCEIIGPQGFFTGDDFLLGLLMLGPNRHYRDHYHPAPELYWPLTGLSQWKQGTGDFEHKDAGAVIWHESGVVHATKTQSEPLLAVWCWTRGTDTPARLVDV